MRLYLSSFRVGNNPEALRGLLRGSGRTALIANACDSLSSGDRIDSTRQELDRLAAVGLKPEELDLRDYFGGDPAALTAVISRYDLVWLRGGNAFNLRRALRQSGADVALLELLHEDGIVYGGYSAGACVLAPSLHGIELVDDPSEVPPGYDATIIWEGLGILPYAVAPHYESTHPESAAVRKLVTHFIDQHIAFKALRDGQALVIDGERQAVVG
jgi:dipeptidase E